MGCGEPVWAPASFPAASGDNRSVGPPRARWNEASLGAVSETSRAGLGGFPRAVLGPSRKHSWPSCGLPGAFWGRLEAHLKPPRSHLRQKARGSTIMEAFHVGLPIALAPK